jgi:hypothetical protein
MSAENLSIDNRCSGDFHSNLGSSWRMVSDTVMGGVSQGQVSLSVVEGLNCIRLQGNVSLDNNGGFIQASLDLGTNEFLDASSYVGIEIAIFGNNEIYNLHLRTIDTRIVWQSYRASFQAVPSWQTLRLPFAELIPHRIDVPLNLSALKRIGFVAIGREIVADLSIASVKLYRQH